uniref:Uncharacterized protein n=1 Tax=Aegilops tauschii subsp. strangulata TaxID=200361 RepID=A0A453A908_AEGTS
RTVHKISTVIKRVINNHPRPRVSGVFCSRVCKSLRSKTELAQNICWTETDRVIKLPKEQMYKQTCLHVPLKR